MKRPTHTPKKRNKVNILLLYLLGKILGDSQARTLSSENARAEQRDRASNGQYKVRDSLTLPSTGAEGAVVKNSTRIVRD